MAVSSPEFPEFPEFIPYDYDQMQSRAVPEDRAYYNRSDADYKRRHPGMLRAEHSYEDMVADQLGGSLDDQMQNEFMTAGLGDALSAFGDTSALAPGSGAEASVARGLGMRIQDYQNQSITRLMGAESLFPRRTFGMSGRDYALMSMLNTAGENNWNQANYANDVNQTMFGYQQEAMSANAEAAGEASQQSAMMQGGAAVAGTVVLAIAL